MIETILAFAKAYPVLAGGVGTVVFGSLMYFVRGVPVWVFGALKRMSTIEISLTSESFLYHEVLEVLSRSRVGAFARCYATDGVGDLVSGFGTSLALFEGRLILFHRELIEKNFRLDEKLHVTIFARNVDILRAIIARAREPKNDDAIKIYSASASGYWYSPVKRRKRALATVFANGDIKERIAERITWFLQNEQWYAARGIPYKLIFLLHGQPGTGKSSLIYGMASAFGRGIAAVSTLSGIDDTLRNLPENTFAAIEDIDMISITREEGKGAVDGKGPAPSTPPATAARGVADMAVQERQLSALQILVNTLDGFATPHGMIMFVTTNHRDRLDAALVRSGRIDHDVEVGPLDAAATEQMFVAFYGENKRGLVRRIVSGAGFCPRTGSDLQLMFMTETAEAAAERLRQSVEKTALHVVSAE